ncbi:MAG: GNAT family N-acetyltransferase [Phycisphaerales bacterium]|nr:GNAT family N-acetyltransferase [Phycisphaerales bacterium]
MISIVHERPARPEEWDAYWRHCPSATYYHARAWSEIWRAASGGRFQPAPTMVGFSDGRTAIVPLTKQRRRRGLLHRYHASPAGTFGGWLAPGELPASHTDAIEAWLGATRRPLVWRRNPFEPRRVTAVPDPASIEVTHALDLRGGRTALHTRWAGSATLRKARKAERAGLTIRAADTLADWRRYYELYEASLQRWADDASSRYEWPLFEALAQRMDAGVTLWLAEHGAQPVAGAVCLASPSIVSYWHGAADAEAFAARPVNLLLTRVVEHACNAGFDWFDFGPSGAHTGVRTFKESFRALPLSCPLTRFDTAGARVMRALRLAA